jgi:hypothetical protein
VSLVGPNPATSPRPALYADSFPKLDAIRACRQDVVQISLKEFPLGSVNEVNRAGAPDKTLLLIPHGFHRGCSVHGCAHVEAGAVQRIASIGGWSASRKAAHCVPNGDTELVRISKGISEEKPAVFTTGRVEAIRDGRPPDLLAQVRFLGKEGWDG